MEIWGRANSVNVQKVLWICEELGLTYTRLDVGGAFGGLDTEQYQKMNPNARVPTLVDGDYVLWESNAILRYLARKHGTGSGLYDGTPEHMSRVDRWMDWALSTLQPAERPMFWGYVRTPPAQRDMAAILASVGQVTVLWTMLDRHLDGQAFVEGGVFTLADIVLGAYVHRWFAIAELERPPLPALEAWYQGLIQRPGARSHLALPLT